MVDTDVLKYARENETKYVIVREGQDLMEAGVIRKQDPASVLSEAQASAPEAQQTFKNVRSQYMPKILGAAGQLSKLKALPEDFGGPGPGEALSKADNAGVDRINDLYQNLRTYQREEKKAMGTLLEKNTKDRVKLYNPAEGVTTLSGSSFNELKQINTPQTPEQMARMHGARTPEEIKSFTDAVEKLNSDRLPGMRENTLRLLEQHVPRQKNPAHKQFYSNLLEKYRNNPKEIPLDHNNNPIMVPNLYYYRQGNNPDGPATAVDYYDFASLSQWNDASGKIRPSGAPGGGERIVSAEHFGKGGQNTIVIRDTSLKDATAIHELGHSMEEIINRRSPQFSQELTARRDYVYEHPGSSDGAPITDYAATSASENLSEGFSLYFSDPKLLKLKDPALHDLVEQEVGFVKSQRR
jgi:hypothetical protein